MDETKKIIVAKGTDLKLRGYGGMRLRITDEDNIETTLELTPTQFKKLRADIEKIVQEEWPLH